MKQQLSKLPINRKQTKITSQWHHSFWSLHQISLGMQIYMYWFCFLNCFSSHPSIQYSSRIFIPVGFNMNIINLTHAFAVTCAQSHLFSLSKGSQLYSKNQAPIQASSLFRIQTEQTQTREICNIYISSTFHELYFDI